MARTHHHHNRAHSARFWNKEGKPARKATTRALRRANVEIAAVALRDVAALEAVTFPVLRGTEGRLSW